MNPRIPSEIADFLLESADFHEKNAFIECDPICIPHRFYLKQDIEITGFILATLAWGNRNAIIRSGQVLCELMDNAPHDFVLNGNSTDFQRLKKFVHRTFNGDDLIYFCEFLKYHYQRNESLESAFDYKNQSIEVETAFFAKKLLRQKDIDVSNIAPIEKSLIAFRKYFFSHTHPQRTEKHVSSLLKNSACKRLNMFLRWMVRKNSPVDFGLWNYLEPEDLHMPLDVHVIRVANQLGILHHTMANWQTCKDITATMKTILPSDPVKLDFALFGIGIEQKS